MEKLMVGKEELMAKTVKELRSIAGECGIVGRHDMTKPQLVEAINAVSVEYGSGDCKNYEAKKVEESPEESQAGCGEKYAGTEDELKKGLPTIAYVENASVGDFVAFRDNECGGKVRSAKITKKSTRRRVLKLETSYGKEFDVAYEDVIWGIS